MKGESAVIGNVQTFLVYLRPPRSSGHDSMASISHAPTLGNKGGAGARMKTIAFTSKQAVKPVRKSAVNQRRQHLHSGFLSGASITASFAKRSLASQAGSNVTHVNSPSEFEGRGKRILTAYTWADTSDGDKCGWLHTGPLQLLNRCA
jgi:hypothetical protein